jgi:surface glycoprotein (TIGR04207 family)
MRRSNTGRMDRQQIIAAFFALLMVMWMIATAATLL